MLGKELGIGIGLTPRILVPDGTASLLNRAEKLNRLCWAWTPGLAITRLMSIGLNTSDDGAGPPRIWDAGTDPDWADARPASAQSASTPKAVAVKLRILPLLPRRD